MPYEPHGTLRRGRTVKTDNSRNNSMGDQRDVSGEHLNHQIHKLRGEVQELSEQVHDLVDAWKTAHGVVRFVKWMGGLATAGTALWVLVKMAFETKR
jgi:hypothetical protein